MIKRLKTKYGVFLSILVLFSIVVTLSYSAFIFSTGKYRSTELLISKLNYGITITEDKTNLSSISGSKVTVPKGSITYYNIVISSINKIDSKYTLAYKTSSNAVVKYTDRTPWNTSGYIKGYDENTYSKRIRVVIDNSSSTSSSTVDFAVYGGYTFNTYASIELSSGYVTVTGPYTEELASLSNRLVDIVENDTGCVTCKNGTTANWDNTDFSIKLKNIHTPDYCTIDFTDGYIVTLTATNGSITPTSQTVGNGGTAKFTVTPNSGFKAELETNTCGGTLSGNTYTISNITSAKSCSITFKSSTPTLLSQILKDNPTIKTRTDFNTTFTETNTGTLYKATESIAGNTPKDVYYFAGDAKNNWVKFGGFYWRIIRTNHDGSIKLLYAGTSPDTTSGYIGTSSFNSTDKDPMYVGYMYGTTGSLENNRLNTNDSTIKTYIDNWYKNNLTAYTKYLSNDAVYCNDRELASGSTYNTGNTAFDYAPKGRLYTNKTPTYNCTNIKDAFSGSNSEAKLTYPIGLMTADEIAYAGGKAFTDLPSPYAWYYLNSAGGSITGSTPWSWYVLSPFGWTGSFSFVWGIGDPRAPGRLFDSGADGGASVRPSVSLLSCNLISGGDGSANNPYIVKTDGSSC